MYYVLIFKQLIIVLESGPTVTHQIYHTIWSRIKKATAGIREFLAKYSFGLAFDLSTNYNGGHSNN